MSDLLKERHAEVLGLYAAWSTLPDEEIVETTRADEPQRLRTVTDVAKAAHLTVAQLQMWIHRGHVQVAHRPSSGKARLFTAEEMQVVKELACQVRQGLTIASAVALIKRKQERRV